MWRLKTPQFTVLMITLVIWKFWALCDLGIWLDHECLLLWWRLTGVAI